MRHPHQHGLLRTCAWLWVAACGDGLNQTSPDLSTADASAQPSRDAGVHPLDAASVPYQKGLARLERLGGAGTWLASTDDIAAMLSAIFLSCSAWRFSRSSFSLARRLISSWRLRSISRSFSTESFQVKNSSLGDSVPAPFWYSSSTFAALSKFFVYFW